MARELRVHRVAGAGVPEIRALQYATSHNSLIKGSICTYTAGEVVNGTANPAEIVGVALQAAASNPGYDMANSPPTITGRNQTVSVAIAGPQTTFRGDLTAGSSTVVAPAVSDIGAQYGVTAYSGKWTVDRSNATDRVEVVGITGTTASDQVIFKFLASVLSGD